MSTTVSISGIHVLSPLGITASDNYQAICRGQSGIGLVDDAQISATPIYAARITRYLPEVEDAPSYSRFEQLCIGSIQEAIDSSLSDLDLATTGLVLATTKGNIRLWEHADTPFEQISIARSADKIAAYFGIAHRPVIVSNACISGVAALITAQRLIQAGMYRTMIVVGADELSRFVVSGFQSLHAMSSRPCRPFDSQRDGINLGEGAATMILTSDATSADTITLGGSGLTNDANHISGPSRTGLELANAIQHAMRGSEVSAADIAFICAHGTATIYNDEMESRAFGAVGLDATPLHSLKGYFGHTLGAAGLIESVMTVCAMQAGIVPASIHYEQTGTPVPLHIITQNTPITLRHALKTASGFGGCNAAIIFTRPS
jgi:3-oxoacyl-[acyl-carrier-protein] synthase I